MEEEDEDDINQQQQQQQQQQQGDDDESVGGSHLVAIVVCLLSLAWLWYYFGYVWTFTKFQNEYTQWFSPPAPGPFVNQQFNFQWLTLAPLILNVFPPLVGLWILLKPAAVWRYDLHKICLLVAVMATIASLLFHILVTWIWENGSSLFPFSIANPVHYCCKWFGSVATSFHCHNFMDCVDLPTVPTIHLHTDKIFEQHILWGMPGCILFAVTQLVVYSMVRNYAPASVQVAPTNRKQRNLDFALRCINVVYVFLVCFYFAVGLLVLDIRYSHEFPPMGPIGIQSARSGIEAVGLVMSGGIVLVPALVLIVMFLGRKNYYGKLAVFVAILVLSVMHLFVFMTMMYSRGTANQPGYPNSLANHPLRCCAGDVAAHPLSQCDNPAAVCVFPIADFPTFSGPLSSHDIPSNSTHTLIFVCMFLFMAMDAAILAIVFVVYLGGNAKRTLAAAAAAINAFIPPSQLSSSFAYGRSGNGPVLLPTSMVGVARMPPAKVFSLNDKTD